MLLAFLLVFAAVSLGSVVDSVKSGEPRWVVILEMAASPPATAALFARWQGWRVPQPTVLWQGVAVFVSAALITLVIRDLLRLETLRDPEMSASEDRWTTGIGVALGLLIEGAAVYLTLSWAFAK